MLGAYCSLQINYHPNADCKPSSEYKPCNGTSRTAHFLCCNASYFGCSHERKVNVKNSIFWEVALCGSCENRPFGVTCRLHLQGRKIRELGKSVNNFYASYEIFYSVSFLHEEFYTAVSQGFFPANPLFTFDHYIHITANCIIVSEGLLTTLKVMLFLSLSQIY
jgi:hypothetical protein